MLIEADTCRKFDPVEAVDIRTIHYLHAMQRGKELNEEIHETSALFIAINSNADAF